MITHTQKWKSYDSFKFRHVSNEQQSSSVHAEPASGCVINVCLMKTCSEIFFLSRWQRDDGPDVTAFSLVYSFCNLLLLLMVKQVDGVVLLSEHARLMIHRFIMALNTFVDWKQLKLGLPLTG